MATNTGTRNVRDSGNERSTAVKQEFAYTEDEDDDVIIDDGTGDNCEGWYREERIIEPPEFDDAMRQSHQEILNDIRNNIVAPYEPPIQVLDIALNLEQARQRDPRRSALRNTAREQRVRTRYIWTPAQDQLIVALAMGFLYKGRDMSTIRPYCEMLATSPMLRHVTDPRRIRSRLQALCHENNLAQLEEYCGYTRAETDEQREMVRNAARNVRASCLDMRLVREWKLYDFVRPKAIVKRRGCVIRAVGSRDRSDLHRDEERHQRQRQKRAGDLMDNRAGRGNDIQRRLGNNVDNSADSGIIDITSEGDHRSPTRLAEKNVIKTRSSDK